MADPLTVLGAFASTVQIIDVLTKAASVLDTLRVQWQSSDIALLSLTSQLGALSAALGKIQEWIESGTEETHHQLTMDLNTTLNCSRLLATKVHNEISHLQRTPGGSLLTTAKARFLFKRSGIGELQNMIDRQTATLTLLLTACNSQSLSQQQEILCASRVRKRIDHVQKDTESLRGTIDSSSFLSRSTERSSKLSMLFDFDRQLFSTRPYSAMVRKTVKLTIRSQNKHVPGPEEVITSITSDATGSVEPTPQLTRGFYSQHPIPPEQTTKLILLGQGEASKSTFLKQMQRMYAPGYSIGERKEWRAIIHENIETAVNSLMLLLDNDSVRIHLERLHSIWPPEITSGPLDVKGFASFVEEVSRTSDPQLRSFLESNTLSYFAEHGARVFNDTYIPTSEDILRARVRTTGIYKDNFDMANHGLCEVFDVGGERPERKKWIHVMGENPTVLVFVPLDSYDQVLWESQSHNRMQEGLLLAESLLNNEWFQQSKLFLCFTRYDVFERKIRSGLFPLRNTFPDYGGPSTDIIACRDYIVTKFTDTSRHHNSVGVFYIDATESEHVKEVVETVLGGVPPTSSRYRVCYKRADSLDLGVDTAEV